MSDPGRHGPAADPAPKVRGRRLREHIARLLAAGWRQDSYADLNQQLDIRTKELSEALEQQTATSEILRVISSSPTDVQPVFDTIAQSAARLCKAQFCHVFRFDGELMHFAASHGLPPEGVEVMRSAGPRRPGRAGDECRDAYIADNHMKWKSARHAALWGSSLEQHISPVFGGVNARR